MSGATRILVVGGGGFIGASAVTELCALGHRPHLAGRSRPARADVEFHAIDILQCADFAPLIAEIRPTHLLHFAWETEPRVYWTSPRNLDWVAASLRLANAFATGGGRRRVVAGPGAAFDWSHHTLDERKTPLAPATPYGRAKASLFQTLEAFAPHIGLSFAWGRIFFPFGPGEKPGKLLTQVAPALIDGRAVDLTDGLQSWDFMHVDDVAAAFVAILLSEQEGAINVASGTSRSVRSVVEAFADRLGARDLLNFGARPRGPGESPYIGAAVARLRDEVGFSPRLSWDAAIDDTLAAFLKAAGQVR